MFSDLKEIVKGPGFMVESFLLSFLSLIEIQSAPVSSTQNVELKIWSGSNDTNSRLSFSDNWNSKFAILQKLWGGYINVIIMIVLSALCALPLYLVELFYEKSLPRAAALRVSAPNIAVPRRHYSSSYCVEQEVDSWLTRRKLWKSLSSRGLEFCKGYAR